MRDAQGHGEVVLSAILAGRGSLKALDFAEGRLTAAHFEDPRQQVLFTIVTRYAQQTRGIITRSALEDVLRERKPGSRALYGEYYDALAAAARMPQRHEFLHSAEQLRVLAARRETGETFSTGHQILTADPDKGVRLEDGTVLAGHEDARSFVLGELGRIEADLRQADSPEGDAHDDADNVLAAYVRARDLRERGEAPGVGFGIPSLDGYMDGGIGPGEMAVILAWTGIGKTRLCVHMAWDVSVQQGKHVVYFTTETLRPQILTYLVARHSVHLGVTGSDGQLGLNSRRIRAGRLNREEETALDMVVKDWKTGDYGRCRVVQMPEHCTVSGMAARFATIERMFPPDLCVVDYLQLFTPDRDRRDPNEREDQAGILKRFKRWCGAVNRGKGVSGVTPWQTGKNGRQAMRSSGGYQLEDAHGTTEAAKTPDVVLSVADREEDTSGGRRVPLELTALKVRDGAHGRRFLLTADYATSYFADRDEPEAVSLDLEEVPGA
jgi:replicative DNA helicase